MTTVRVWRRVDGERTEAGFFSVESAPVGDVLVWMHEWDLARMNGGKGPDEMQRRHLVALDAGVR